MWGYQGWMVNRGRLEGRQLLIPVRKLCACSSGLLGFLSCMACPLVTWAEICPQRFLPQWLMILAILYIARQHWRGDLLWGWNIPRAQTSFSLVHYQLHSLDGWLSLCPCRLLPGGPGASKEAPTLSVELHHINRISDAYEWDLQLGVGTEQFKTKARW